MSWVRQAAPRDVRFIANAYVRVWITEDSLREHPEVERIQRLEMPAAEKIRALTEREDDILHTVANEQLSSVGLYAERSQHVKIDFDLGKAEGTVDWERVLRLDTAST